MKTYIHKETCTCMFTEVLFVTKIGKNVRMTQKLVYTHLYILNTTQQLKRMNDRNNLDESPKKLC